MKLRFLVPGLLMVLMAGSAFAADAAWRPLFNGKDFTGWETYLSVPLPTSEVPGEKRDEKGNYTQVLGVNVDPLKCFSVVEVDGKPAIRLSGEGFGTLATLETFSNYHLRFQFKWGTRKWLPGSEKKPRGSGLLYHGHGNHGDGDEGKRWMHHQQYQIQEGNCGEYVAVGDTACDITARKVDEKKFVYDPKASALMFSAKTPNQNRCNKSEVFEKDGWNTLELVCVGDEALQIVNGHVVLRLTGSRKAAGDGYEPLTGGKLLLQMEGSEIFFRDIEIKAVTEVPAEFAAK
ncbi:MAG: DUF1080 domain-containing protein [Nibricoccus sp.]